MASGVLSCSKCCKRYRLRRALAVHVASCLGPDPDKSVLVRGPAMAIDLLHTQELGVYTSERKNPDLEGVAVETVTRECLIFPRLWAI